MKILDGRKARESRIPILIKKISDLSHAPVLAIIQVGDRADSNSYISSKKNFAKKIGIEVKHIKLDENVSKKGLINEIQKLNNDNKVNAIIVQLPIPSNLDKKNVIDAIIPSKDVDALTASSVEHWENGTTGAIFPATARGVIELLEYYEISLKNKKVVVLGRSELVGKPIAVLCEKNGAHITVCHSKTLDLVVETQKADIIISAVGKLNLISKQHVKSGQIIIDVGINTIQGEKLDDEPDFLIQTNKKLVGDVDFDGVKDIVDSISPVPGGVGPMTVLALFENLIDLIKRNLLLAVL